MKRKLPIILPCMAALLLCVPLFARFFPLWAAKAPVFTDIIIETTAKTGINKQGELTLFRLLTVLGLLLCCLTGFLLSARQMKLRNPLSVLENVSVTWTILPDRSSPMLAGDLSSHTVLDILLVWKIMNLAMSPAPTLLFWSRA